MKRSRWLSRLSMIAASTLLCTAVATLVGSTSIGRWLELRTYDLRFKLRGPLPQSTVAPITLVAIDEEALAAIQEPLMLWHRTFAKVIDYLVSRRVAVIGVDFIFANISKFDPEGERLLSASLFNAGASSVPIVLVYRIRADGVEQPTESVRLAALAAGHTLAFANLTTDSDDFVRRQQILAFGEDNSQEQGFALAVAGAFARKRQIRFDPPKLPDQTLLINYRGTGHFKRLSFAKIAQAADGGSPDTADQDLRDRIVLIGRVGEAGDEDLHSTPQYFSPGAFAKAGESVRTPGLEIHANVITTLLENNRLRTPAAGQQIALTFLLVLLVSFFCFRFAPSLALVLSASVIVGFLAAACLGAFSRGFWIMLVAPVSGSVLAVGSAEIINYMIEGREKRHLRNLFKRYVNDKVIEKILQSPKGLSLAGERKRISVLFADIRGFTTRSEKAPAEDVVKDLNDYFGEMVTVIQDYGGMVDKFIGDGLMAIFGAPMDDPDSSLHSVQAAQAMSLALRRVNRKLEARGAAPISIGIGIHTGEAVLGNIGSAQKMEYTAIGDVVNVASRIEGLTRKFDSEILVSGEALNAVGEKIRAKSVGEEFLKGRTNPISVYAVSASQEETGR